MRGPWAAVAALLILVVGVGLGVILDRSLWGLSSAKAKDEEQPHSRVPAEVPGMLWFDCHDNGHTVAVPRPPAKWLIDHLRVSLDLSDDQAEALLEVAVASREETDALWRETRLAFCDIQADYRQDLRAPLDPTQVEKLNRLTAQYDQSLRERASRMISRPSREGKREARP